jgi:chromosome segregation ATPase
LDGEVVDRHGVVTGGSSGDVSGQFLAKKREISELRVEVARLSQEVSARTGELTSLKDRLQVNESRMSDLKNQVHSHEVEFVHKERDVQGLAQQAEGLKIARDRLTLETVELSSQRDAGLK